MSAEYTQELIGADGTPEKATGKKQGVPLHAQAIHPGARQSGGVNVRALEPFVPIARVVNDPPVDILLP